MKPSFPRVHSCTVHSPITEFCFLIMDCGHQIEQSEVVFDPTEDGSPQERQPITCSECRVGARQVEREDGATIYEYGLVDIRALREWEKSRRRES